jgi:hypothetical protein
VIETDDPEGIEGYWHGRFDDIGRDVFTKLVLNHWHDEEGPHYVPAEWRHSQILTLSQHVHLADPEP